MADDKILCGHVATIRRTARTATICWRFEDGATVTAKLRGAWARQMWAEVLEAQSAPAVDLLAQEWIKLAATGQRGPMPL